MRLRRLDLTRYGRFTDQSLDFGPRPEGLPDLHIVYGPNEAGKSTAFAAFLDLLFGIGMQSPFDFLHPYSTMRIGGLLEFGNEARAFTRIKRPQNSLLDSSDRPISESAIRGELGGIDREAYRTMFSLDDETLEKGGDGILASKGDLGELLFSASAGLADLSRKLVDLKGEADRFYKFRARSGQLADLKARLSELKPSGSSSTHWPRNMPGSSTSGTGPPPNMTSPSRSERVSRREWTRSSATSVPCRASQCSAGCASGSPRSLNCRRRR